ncbi:hypothetical protein TNCV_4832911 [Trichonephila clavipes]|nr:hypothetical protein TNCV_4832911 [Trichonephila clavipes]
MSTLPTPLSSRAHCSYCHSHLELLQGDFRAVRSQCICSDHVTTQGNSPWKGARRSNQAGAKTKECPSGTKWGKKTMTGKLERRNNQLV